MVSFGCRLSIKKGFKWFRLFWSPVSIVKDDLNLPDFKLVNITYGKTVEVSQLFVIVVFNIISLWRITRPVYGIVCMWASILTVFSVFTYSKWSELDVTFGTTNTRFRCTCQPTFLFSSGYYFLFKINLIFSWIAFWMDTRALPARITLSVR